MGGSSKKQTVGYKYFFGLHMGIGRGPVDALHEIRVADKQAWYGRVTGNKTIKIDKPDLFGGEEKEGGVKGSLEVMMGEPTQEASTGLKAMLGSLLPGFRGMFTVFYNGLVSVNNPYPKAWKFRLNRVLKGWDGAVWYPEKAPILLGTGSPYFDDIVTISPTIPPVDIADQPLNIVDSPDVSAAISGESFVFNVTGDGNFYLMDAGGSSSEKLNTRYESNLGETILRANVKFQKQLSSGTGDNIRFLVYGYGRTQYGFSFRKESGQIQLYAYASVNDVSQTILLSGGARDGLYEVVANTSGEPDTWYVSWRIEGVEVRRLMTSFTPQKNISFGPANGDGTGVSQLSIANVEVVRGRGLGAINGMNPAHIIYECLTNRVWGRGLPASKLDIGSFVSAADTLFDENFAMCLKWTRKDSIENFIQGVIDHIGATLYVSRTTKLYTLKLIRGGYNLNDLPLFDTESGILSISDATVASVGSTVNAVQVKYHDWENDEERTVSVKNAAAIVAAGGIVNQVTRDFPGIPVASLALRVAQRELRAVSTALRKFTITMDRRGEDFAPGDVFAIQDPKRGIPKMAVRVGRVEDGTLLDGKITLTVVQDVFTLPATTMAADVPSTWVPPNNTPCIDQQRVFEAPYFLMVRTMSKADLDYVGPDSGYIATLNSRGQPLNQGYKIAVRPDAPTVDDNPADDSYTCGI